MKVGSLVECRFGSSTLGQRLPRHGPGYGRDCRGSADLCWIIVDGHPAELSLAREAWNGFILYEPGWYCTHMTRTCGTLSGGWIRC